MDVYALFAGMIGSCPVFSRWALPKDVASLWCRIAKNTRSRPCADSAIAIDRSDCDRIEVEVSR